MSDETRTVTRERAEAFREAVLEARRIRGTLAKVSVEDFVTILAVLDSPEARAADAALRDPAPAGLDVERLLDEHFPFIKFERDGLPYLVCQCGWDDRGDAGWGDHMDDALAKPDGRAEPQPDHEHYWVDAPDDETGWHCTICDLREYPKVPPYGAEPA